MTNSETITDIVKEYNELITLINKQELWLEKNADRVTEKNLLDFSSNLDKHGKLAKKVELELWRDLTKKEILEGVIL